MPFGNTSALDCFMKKMRNEFTPPRDIVPELSDRVDKAIRRAMSASPDARPASCREFVEDLYGKSTRPASQASADQPVEQDIWYLVYQDETGASHTVKGGTEGICKALRDGLLGDAGNIIACRNKQGPFLPLRNYPEFRLLIVQPEPMAPPSLTPTKPPAPGLPSGPWPEKATTPTAQVGGLRPRAATPARSAATATADRLQPRPARGRLPQIPLINTRRAGFDMLLWAIVLVVALGTAFGVYYMFPPN
jgi:hypothetical protein